MVLAVVLCSGFLKDTHDLQFMLCLWVAWAMTLVTVSSVRVLLKKYDACRACCEHLKAERERFEMLKHSLAMARLRGCPFSAKSPVVVQSSPEFDQLFGGPMQGMSLGKAFVAHGQTLKGLDAHTIDMHIKYIIYTVAHNYCTNYCIYDSCRQ